MDLAGQPPAHIEPHSAAALSALSPAPPRVRGSARSSLSRISSMYAVTREFLDDIRIHRLRIGDIQVALRNRAVALLGEAPPVQRRGQPRIDLQGGVEIGNRVLGQPALQVDKATAVEGIDKVRAQPKRLVAIPQRRLQVADHGAGPAAVVVGLDVLRIEPDRVVEVLDGEAIGPLAGIDLSAPVERARVVGIVGEPDGQALDGRVIGERWRRRSLIVGWRVLRRLVGRRDDRGFGLAAAAGAGRRAAAAAVRQPVAGEGSPSDRAAARLE